MVAAPLPFQPLDKLFRHRRRPDPRSSISQSVKQMSISFSMAQRRSHACILANRSRSGSQAEFRDIAKSVYGSSPSAADLVRFLKQNDLPVPSQLQDASTGTPAVRSSGSARTGASDIPAAADPSAGPHGPNEPSTAISGVVDWISGLGGVLSAGSDPAAHLSASDEREAEHTSHASAGNGEEG